MVYRNVMLAILTKKYTKLHRLALNAKNNRHFLKNQRNCKNLLKSPKNAYNVQEPSKLTQVHVQTAKVKPCITVQIFTSVPLVFTSLCFSCCEQIILGTLGDTLTHVVQIVTIIVASFVKSNKNVICMMGK